MEPRKQRNRDHDTDSDGNNNTQFRRSLRQRLKDAAPGLATAVAVAGSSGVVFAATSIRDIPTLVNGLKSGDASAIAATGLVLGVAALGTLAAHQRKAAQSLDSHAKDFAEIKRDLSRMADIESVCALLRDQDKEKTALIDALDHEVKTLREQLYNDGHEIDEYQDLYRPMPETIFLLFHGKMLREADEVLLETGLTFRASDWAIATWLPRITKGTALSHFEIVFVVPKVDPILLPAAERETRFLLEKFVRVIEDLVEIGKRRGLHTTVDNIRVSIARNVPVEHCDRSIVAYTRQTDQGAEPTVVTYQRSYTNRAANPTRGKVLVYRGEADRRFWSDRAQLYYHNGIQLTFEQARVLINSGAPLPYPPEDIAATC